MCAASWLSREACAGSKTLAHLLQPCTHLLVADHTSHAPACLMPAATLFLTCVLLLGLLLCAAQVGSTYEGETLTAIASRIQSSL